MADTSTEQLPIGKRIMRYRVRAGMSRAQLSGLIGKSPSWLYKVERGVLVPDRLSVLSELATVLRVDIGELAGAPVPTALLSPAATVPPPVPAAVVHEVEDAAPPVSEEPAVVVVPPASEEPAVVSAVPPFDELAPPLAVVAAPPPSEEPAPAPAVVSATATPWRQTTAGERRRAVAAVVAAAAAIAAFLLLSGAASPPGADSPRARAAPPMTVFPAPGADTPLPRPTAGPGSPAGSNPVAGPPPGAGPRSAAPPGPAAARPTGGTPAALRSQGAGARTSTAVPAPSGTASQSPPAWDLAAWWPYASAASSGACGGSSSSGCNQGSAQAGQCSNVAYDGDTGAVPDTGVWHISVQLGSGGTLCAHWDNAGIEGTLTGPDGRSRLVPGGTWMVLSGGPGRYTLQLRRIDPSRPDHAHLQMFG
jgi:transcriptional regulator with XRE-family HTH domain